MMVIISGISLIGISQAFALNCASNEDGTWNDPNTWRNCGDGVPDDTGDSARIEEDDIQLNNDFVIGIMNVEEAGSLSVNGKLTTDTTIVSGDSEIFINCSGELIMASTVEASSNNGLLTNHGIVRSFDFFDNLGTYLSSGTDEHSGTFSGNDIEPIRSICFIGGDIIPLDTTMVLAAGAQYTAAWMIPVIVSAIGIGIVIARKF